MITSTLITLALAEYASRDDFHQIGKGSKIRHGLQWLFRAAVVALACYLDDCMLYAVPLAFLFSAVFRWRLNGLRGKDWRYIGPWSSWYDRRFVVLIAMPYGIKVTSEFIELVRADYFKNDLRARLIIHRAGTMAYIFEAVCFVVGTVWYICSA